MEIETAQSKPLIKIELVCSETRTQFNNFWTPKAFFCLHNPKGLAQFEGNCKLKWSKCDCNFIVVFFQVKPGQRINITLWDFALEGGSDLSYPGDTCFRYAVIKVGFLFGLWQRFVGSGGHVVTDSKRQPFSAMTFRQNSAKKFEICSQKKKKILCAHQREWHVVFL